MCFVVAVLAFLGWQFDIDLLKQPSPKLVVIHPLSVFMLLLASAGLYLHHARSPKFHLLAHGMASLCLLTAILTLIGKIYPAAMPIEQWFYPQALDAGPNPSFPNRFSPTTALNFIGVGIALLVIHRPWRWRPEQAIAVGVAFLSWFSILGYSFRVPEFYRLSDYLPMAVPTAICFQLLAFALITFHPDRGFARQIFSTQKGGMISRVLFPSVLLIPMVLGYLRLQLHWANVVSTEFGVGILITSISLMLAIIIYHIVRLLNISDLRQQQYQDALLALNEDLQHKNNEIGLLNEELRASNEELVAMNDQLSLASDKIQEQSQVILKQKDEQLNRVLDSSHDVIWSIDLTGQSMNYISRSATRLFGESVSAGLFTDADFWMSRIHADDLARKQESDRQLFETGTTTCVFRTRIASGEYRWIRQRSWLVYDADGRALRQEGIASDVTVLREQEEALHQYQEKLDVIFSNTVEEILLLDNEGRVVLFNHAFDRFMTLATGRKPQIGKYIWETTLTERSEASRQLFARAQGGERIVLDVTAPTPKGDVIHEIRYDPMYIDGIVKYVTITASDVTEKKRREHTLQQSEANLRALFDNTEDAFILLDKDYCVVMFNAASLKISSQELRLGINMLDLIPEHRKKIFRIYLDMVARSGTVRYQLNTGEGHDLTCYYITISAVQTDAGLVGYCITTSDYTAVKRGEISLRENEERFRALVENSDDIICLVATDGTVKYTNPGTERIMGYTSQELLSMTSADLIHPDDQPLVATFIREVTGSPEKLVPAAFRTRHKDGHWIWLEGTACNLSNLAAINGIVINFRDVTERRHAEDERSNLVTQLIEQNNNLRQFSFIASHNLRGPVASMLGLLNLVKPGQVTGEPAEILGMLQKSARNLDTVIKDLSAILEMRSSELQAKEWISLRETVQTIVTALQTQIEECRAEIVIDDQAIDNFYTIKGYFHSILYNLISNAIKYRSLKRQLRVEITTFQNPSACGFRVRDNGSGLDMKQHGAKLFGLYQRFNLETEGKGLGLYMVRSQVNILNGTIAAESTPEAGATFTVTFRQALNADPKRHIHTAQPHDRPANTVNPPAR